MRLKKFKSTALAGILFVFIAGGCGEVEFGAPDQEVAQQDKSVTVVPEFSVTGTASVPDKLFLSELGLTISEIRLEPLTSDTGAVAYSTRTPTRLQFDVAHGETIKLGEPVQLPEAGKYLVSVRLEPITEITRSQEGSSEIITPSFSVEGFVASEGIVRVDPRYNNKRSDGSPVPMPFDEKEADDKDKLQDMPERSSEWTPFQYNSERSVFFTLNEVEFAAGKQYLSFEFDVKDWALEFVDPLLTAVKHNAEVDFERERGIDVTSPLESTGHGAESLFENARVRTLTQETPGF